MNKEGKNFSTCVNRISLIGDIFCSISVLTLMRKLYPNCYNTLSVARKCSQSVPFFINHKDIDRIHINEFLENPKKEEYDFLYSHDIYAAPNIQHPKQNWQNYYSIYEENFVMLGLDYKLLSNEELYPKLDRYFDVRELYKTVIAFPFAGYGKDKFRSPSFEYWLNIFTILIKMGYRIFHFGHNSEPDFRNRIEVFLSDFYTNYTHLNLFQQFQIALGGTFALTCDSGTSLLLGGYDFPQVNLVCQWNLGHIQNPLALAPHSKNCINLWDREKCDNIPQEKVLESIKQLTS